MLSYGMATYRKPPLPMRGDCSAWSENDAVGGRSITQPRSCPLGLSSTATEPFVSANPTRLLPESNAEARAPAPSGTRCISTPSDVHALIRIAAWSGTLLIQACPSDTIVMWLPRRSGSQMSW